MKHITWQGRRAT